MIIEVPWDTLDPKTLHRLVNEFVTRDGTDYGAQETSLEKRIDQVMRALERGDATVTWDQTLNSATIVRRELLPKGE